MLQCTYIVESFHNKQNKKVIFIIQFKDERILYKYTYVYNVTYLVL